MYPSNGLYDLIGIDGQPTALLDKWLSHR